MGRMTYGGGLPQLDPAASIDRASEIAATAVEAIAVPPYLRRPHAEGLDTDGALQAPFSSDSSVLSSAGSESVMAIERALPAERQMHNEPGPAVPAALGKSASGLTHGEPAGHAIDGGPWQGPTEAAWTARLLRGALRPR